MYHISDIKKYIRCDRLYLYSKGLNSSFKPYLRSDESINDVLISYFNMDKYFLGQRNEEPKVFLNAINEYEWFIHPRLADGELRINIPVMHKIDDKFDLYFINYGVQIKDLDLLNYRICKQVLKRNNIEINNVYIIYFNSEYTNNGILDPKQLLICSDTYKESRIIDLINAETFDYDAIIENMETLNIDNCIGKKSRYCKFNGLCEYYDKCFPDEEDILDDSILTLVSSANKNKMYESGIKSLKDVDIKQLEGNKVQYAQIMASKNNGTFVDKLVLGKWLQDLDVRPISFIDFEWDRYLIPPYKNMKPLDVLCFEFALYYIDENGHMEHRTFVGTGDCRKEFIEGLIEYLPSSGPILAYNSEGAECLRLKELGEMFPEYKEYLDSVISRFVDLAIPFINGLVYDVRMKGNFTLKKLVDICSEYSYKDLDIYDGMQAVYNWRDIVIGSEEGETIIDNLKKYCSLDAYGLFLVYKWLLELMIALE